MGGRLIDADALKKRVSELIVPDWTRTLIRSWLDSEPTVDAVPVVRCGECNRHEEPRDTCLKAFIWCNLYNTHKFKDGYCNCGERKDGERRTE